jgi:serine/threonine protein kinase
MRGVREVIAAARGGGAAVGKGTTRRKVTPKYPDAKTQKLSEELEKAWARRQNLEEAGLNTDQVDQEILNLRRALREGGQLRAGDTLGDGRYLLIEHVGRGGFSTVWKAEDRRRGETVAVKVLHSQLAAEPSRRERFFRGAHRMVELAGDAVVPILQADGEDSGYFYFVMRLIAGGDLQQAVLRKRVSSGDIPRIILQVGSALARAHTHTKKLVHRDVKPSNILLDEDGTAWLTDFDLVFAADTTGGTRTGALGTFLYAAPEMMERPQDADPRADVYSLGMTAIFGLSGRELTHLVLRDAEKVIRGLACTDEVKSVLRRAVELEKEARFSDAGELCEALRSALRSTVRAAPDPLGVLFKLKALKDLERRSAQNVDEAGRAVVVARIIDVGETSVGAAGPRIKTSQQRAVSLASLIDLAGADGLDPRVALRIGLDVLEVLSVGQSLKREVLVDGGLWPGRIYIVDGIAGVSELGSAGVDQMSLSSVGGLRLGYMAPEIIKNSIRHPSQRDPVDERADLFSVAVILWELLARQRLFRAKMDAAVIQKVLTAPIPPLATLPKVRVVPAPAVDAALLRALERDSARRYQSAEAFSLALARAGPLAIATHAEVHAAVGKLIGPARPGGRGRLVPSRIEVSTVVHPAAPDPTSTEGEEPDFE